MWNSLSSYAEWIQLESFFSGYIFVYVIIYLAALNLQGKNFAQSVLLPKLPLVYAIAGTLYLGLQLKNLSRAGTIDNFTTFMQIPYLKIWGLLSVLFWIPLLRKKTIFSLLHSLVFFFLLICSLFLQFFPASSDAGSARNNMKIYSVSILLHLAILIVVTTASLLIARIRKKNSPSP
jgi:cytochrome bd-type quinol oxidase subunit 2